MIFFPAPSCSALTLHAAFVHRAIVACASGARQNRIECHHVHAKFDAVWHSAVDLVMCKLGSAIECNEFNGQKKLHSRAVFFTL